MSDYTAHATFALPVGLLREVDRRAEQEGRSRSSLLRTLIVSALAQGTVQKENQP